MESFGIVLEVVVPNESKVGADLTDEIASLAGALKESGTCCLLLAPCCLLLAPCGFLTSQLR